jgi:Tol biopolymer transport system component
VDSPVLKRLGNVSIVHVIGAGMGCGFLALLVFMIAFLVLTSRFGPSSSTQVTLEVEPYLTALASDFPASSPSATITVSATETLWLAPPSGKIVYSCYFDGFDDICIMDADGSNQKRLTEVKATDFYASLTPDGSSILFSSRRLEGFQIYRMDLDGENLERLTDDLGSLYAPSMSPDGSTIVFTRERWKQPSRRNR